MRVETVKFCRFRLAFILLIIYHGDNRQSPCLSVCLFTRAILDSIKFDRWGQTFLLRMIFVIIIIVSCVCMCVCVADAFNDGFKALYDPLKWKRNHELLLAMKIRFHHYFTKPCPPSGHGYQVMGSIWLLSLPYSPLTLSSTAWQIYKYK